MSKRQIALAILALILVVFGVFGVFNVRYAGYKAGYSRGLSEGYTDGYNGAVNSFPQLELNDLTFEDGSQRVFIKQLTVTGEQHILDRIKELPNMSDIFSIKTKEPPTGED